MREGADPWSAPSLLLPACSPPTGCAVGKHGAWTGTDRGRDRPVCTYTERGPLCKSCYRRVKAAECDDCGRVTAALLPCPAGRNAQFRGADPATASRGSAAAGGSPTRPTPSPTPGHRGTHRPRAAPGPAADRPPTGGGRRTPSQDGGDQRGQRRMQGGQVEGVAQRRTGGEARKKITHQNGAQHTNITDAQSSSPNSPLALPGSRPIPWPAAVNSSGTGVQAPKYHRVDRPATAESA